MENFNSHLDSNRVTVGIESERDSVLNYIAPYAVTLLSTISSLAVVYVMTTVANDEEDKANLKTNFEKSTVLPGYGMLGDRVNEVIELFLNTLAIYVHK